MDEKIEKLWKVMKNKNLVMIFETFQNMIFEFNGYLKLLFLTAFRAELWSLVKLDTTERTIASLDDSFLRSRRRRSRSSA